MIQFTRQASYQSSPLPSLFRAQNKGPWNSVQYAFDALRKRLQQLGNSEWGKRTVRFLRSPLGRAAAVTALGLAIIYVGYRYYQSRRSASVPEQELPPLPRAAGIRILRHRRRLHQQQPAQAVQRLHAQQEQIEQIPAGNLPNTRPMVAQFRQWFQEAMQQRPQTTEERVTANLDYVQVRTDRYAAMVHRLMEDVQLPEEFRQAAMAQAVQSFYDYSLRCLTGGDNQDLTILSLESQSAQREIHSITDPFFVSPEHIDTLLIGFLKLRREALTIEQVTKDLQDELGESCAQVMEILDHRLKHEPLTVGLKNKLCRLFNNSQRLILRDRVAQAVSDQGFANDIVQDPGIIGSDIHLNQSWLTDSRIEQIVKHATSVHQELGHASQAIERMRLLTFRDALPTCEAVILRELPKELAAILKGQIHSGSAQEMRDNFRLIVNRAYVTQQLESRFLGKQPGSRVQQLILHKAANVSPSRYDQVCLEVVAPMHQFLERLLIPNVSRGVAVETTRRRVEETGLVMLMAKLNIPPRRHHELIMQIRKMQALEAKLRAEHIPSEETIRRPMAQPERLGSRFPELIRVSKHFKALARERHLQSLIKKCIDEGRDEPTAVELEYFSNDRLLERSTAIDWGFYRRNFSREDHRALKGYVEGIQGYSPGLALGGSSGRCAAISTRVLTSLLIQPDIALANIRSNEWTAADGFLQAFYASAFRAKAVHPSEQGELKPWTKVVSAHQSQRQVTEKLLLQKARSATETPEAFARSILDELKDRKGALRLGLTRKGGAHSIGFYTDPSLGRHIWHDANSMVAELPSRKQLEATFVDFVKTYWKDLKSLDVSTLERRQA